MSQSDPPRQSDLPLRSQPSPDEPEAATASRRGPLVALVVVLLLVVAGILLTNVLHRVTTVQDCVMQGRRNCAPVSAGTGG